ncbi:MAG: hypothetical protein IIC67_08550 [Thaumarchaeota archaeon]|nr:hypothetical protein [Nitrososphaerota archaeon]
MLRIIFTVFLSILILALAIASIFVDIAPDSSSNIKVRQIQTEKEDETFQQSDKIRVPVPASPESQQDEQVEPSSLAPPQSLPSVLVPLPIAMWKRLVDNYYSELEIFLIDEKIKTIIKTPVLGLTTSSQLIEINKQVSLIQLNGQRPVSFNESTDAVKYVYAFHDLVYEYFTDKIGDEVQNVEDIRNIWQTKRAQIRDFLIVLRLHHKGKIGFLDSHLSHSIFHGGQSWKNFDCDLEADWSKWDGAQHQYILQSPDVIEINKLWNELHKIDFNINENKFLLIAINRFMISYEKENPEDKILDLMICLESLLQGEQGELRFRLSIRTALFLETDKSKRNRIYKIVKKGYDVRSDIAHGGDASVVKIDEQEITLEQLVIEIEEYVRRSIKEFIKQLNDNKNRGTIIRKLDDSILL